jgi:hypothetical protein
MNLKEKIMRKDFSELLGKTLTKVYVNSDHDDDDMVIFYVDDGSEYMLSHSQSCCECVTIDSIDGNCDDLIGTPITMAEKSQSDYPPKSECHDSYTWTFYRLATAKGYVTVRWYGYSNGYYSESADFELLGGENYE